MSLSRYSDTKAERREYWKRPGVWADVKASFERFFELNPDAVGWRHDYARCAYWCEQWDDLTKQLALFGPTNYAFFGGKAAFDKMCQEAREHAGSGSNK
jgi:hypothetical protein